MVCYHPLKAFPVGLTNNNKIKYKITSYDIDHLEIEDNDKIKCVIDKLVSPYCRKVIREFIEVPCGQCIGCRLDYSRQWADRCLIEMKQHKESWFVTLTYNDLHIPMHEFLDYNTGSVERIASLQKRDFQLFMKRLRKNYKYDNKLRFFAAGEYGTQSLRPHYHAIIFGLHLDDTVFYKRSSQGFSYYNSSFLDECWQKKGFVVAAPACWETCAYTARYILKKQKGKDSKVYEDFNFEPEFTLMSRKPGIARGFFEDNVEKIFSQDCIYVPTMEGSKAIYPSRYYKKLFQALDEESFLQYKELKELGREDIKKAKLAQTTNSYLEMLAVEEGSKTVSIKSLKRNSL